MEEVFIYFSTATLFIVYLRMGASIFLARMTDMFLYDINCDA